MCAENIKMKSRKLAFFTMLLISAASVTVAVSVMVSEDAFAKDVRYSGDTSQAASVSNECLNPILDSNTIDNIVDVGNCAGTVSQQDESGSAAAPITSQTANPTIELQRATTTSAQPPLTGESCEDCFDSLTAAQVSEFENELPVLTNDPEVTTIEELCDFMAALSNPGEFISAVISTLQGLPSNIPPPSQQTLNAIEACLIQIFP
jgi:hypothetical protein